MKILKYLLIFTIVLSIVSPFVEMHFPELHVGDTLTNLNDPTWTSALKQKVLKYPEIYIGGVEGVDGSVIFYLTEEGRNKIYGGTHSLKIIDECNRLAGGDEKKQIFCLGMGNHLSMDITSHGYKEYEGYTSLCVKKYAATNIFLHSICERGVVNNYLNNLNKFPHSPTKDEIRIKTCDSYDILIQGDENWQTGQKCTNEYVKLLSDSAGVDLCEAVHIVGSNLKMMCTENKASGSGYTDIYRSKIPAPTNWKWTLLIAFILLIMILLANMILGTGWKYVSLIFLIPLLIISGAGIYYTFLNTQQFYHDYNFIMLDPLTNIIKVPDWENRIQKSIQDTHDYLSDPNFEIPKAASGLDHYEDGILIKGTLDKAENIGSIIWWSIIVVLSGLFLIVEYLTFRRK